MNKVNSKIEEIRIRNQKGKLYVFLFAVFGSILGLIVHLNALLYDYRISYTYFYLIVGILAIGLPGSYFVRELDPKDAHEADMRRLQPIKTFRLYLKNAPAWLRILIIISFLYVPIIIYLLSLQKGTPKIIEGQYILYLNGQLNKILTKNEYDYFLARDTKILSAIWIAFYIYVAGVLYPFNHKQITQEQKQ
jgi:MFS family permease